MQNERGKLKSYQSPDIGVIQSQDIDIVTVSGSSSGNRGYDDDKNQAEWD